MTSVIAAMQLSLACCVHWARKSFKGEHSRQLHLTYDPRSGYSSGRTLTAVDLRIMRGRWCCTTGAIRAHINIDYESPAFRNITKSLKGSGLTSTEAEAESQLSSDIALSGFRAQLTTRRINCGPKRLGSSSRRRRFLDPHKIIVKTDFSGKAR